MLNIDVDIVAWGYNTQYGWHMHIIPLWDIRHGKWAFITALKLPIILNRTTSSGLIIRTGYFNSSTSTYTARRMANNYPPNYPLLAIDYGLWLSSEGKVEKVVCSAYT